MATAQLESRSNFIVDNWTRILGFGVPLVLLFVYIGPAIVDGGARGCSSSGSSMVSTMVRSTRSWPSPSS